jgi:hypothetical protein
MLAIGVTVVVGILVLVFLLVRQKKKADELLVQLALKRTAAKVAGLEADKAARVLELGTNKQAADKLDKEIADAKRATVATVEKVDGMSDTDIAAEFKKLGY